MMFWILLWNPWVWLVPPPARKGQVIDYRHSVRARRAWGDKPCD